MAGHSHWAGIKHKKAAQDARRGKVFSKIARAIIAAARKGGGDPATNLSLRYALDKARAANMPRDTIDRAVKRGAGEVGGEEIQEVTYEAYGPGGAGILVLALTDNANRTLPEVRTIVEKRGGSLGKHGSVAWNFEQKALFTVDRAGVEEDRLMEVALEAGADDVADEGDAFAVTAPPDAFQAISDALDEAGIPRATSEVGFIPKSRVMLSADDAQRMIQLIEALEENDDVQTAITNADLPAEVVAELR